MLLASFCFLVFLLSPFQNPLISLSLMGFLFQLAEQKMASKLRRITPMRYSSLLLHGYRTNLRAGRQPHESLVNWMDAGDEEVSRIFKSTALKIARGCNIDRAISEGFSRISNALPELSYVNQISDSDKLMQSEMELLENQMRNIFNTNRSRSQVFTIFASFALFIVPFSASLVLVLFQPNKFFISAFMLIYPISVQIALSALRPQEVDILS